jgi:hypothetical protein
MIRRPPVPKQPWEVFEQDVQTLFGLDSNPGSGNQWNAPGDAVDNNHPSETVFPLLFDCKDTELKGYRLTPAWLKAQHDRALGLGKRFAMPLRFRDKRSGRHHDYVVMDLNDLAELMELARGNHTV